MTQKFNGGPAFPFHYEDQCTGEDSVSIGMTMRDWFAGMVLQGLMTDRFLLNQPEGKTPAEHVADNAYAIADAMLAGMSK